jgi:hypothetical protein
VVRTIERPAPPAAAPLPATVIARTNRLTGSDGPEVALLEEDEAGEHRYAVAITFSPERWRTAPLFKIAKLEGSGGYGDHEVRLRRLAHGTRPRTFIMLIDVDHTMYQKGGTGGVDDHLHPETVSKQSQTLTVWIDFASGAPRVILSVPTEIRFYENRNDEFPDHEAPKRVAHIDVTDRQPAVELGPAHGTWPRELADLLGTHDVPLVRAYWPLEL